MSEKKGFLSGLFGDKKSSGCCNMEIIEENDAEQTSSCCCNGDCSTSEASVDADECCGEKVDGICCIKVLGAGCASCHKQYENVKEAVSNIGLNVDVEYITDMEKVMTYGVMSMPAIVINDKVVSMGKVLKVSEVENLLKK